MRISLVLSMLVLLPLVPAGAQSDDAGAFATYEVVLQGEWAEEPEERPDRLSFTFQDPRWIRGHDGRWVPAYPVAWQGPIRDDGAWKAGEGTRFLHVETGAWLASSGSQASDDGSRSNVFDVASTWDSRSEDGSRATYLPPGTHDCFLAAPKQPGLRCQVPGVTSLSHDAWRERTEDGWIVHASDGHQRMRFVYAHDVPYPARVEVQDLHASALLVLRLLDWQAWAPLEPEPASLVDLEPVRLGHARTHTAPEAGIAHPFPLSTAIEAALAEHPDNFLDDRETTPRAHRYDLDEYIAAYPQAVVFHASYMRIDDEPHDHQWTLGWTNGWSTLWVRADQNGDPPPLLNEMLGGDNRTFRYVDPPIAAHGALPRVTDLVGDLPPVAENLRYWRAYAGDAFNGTAPDAWGHHLTADRGWVLWAGYAHSEEHVDATPTETIVTTTVRTSYLFMDGSGDVLGYEERTVVTEEGESYGPSTARSVREPAAVRSGPPVHAMAAGPAVQQVPAAAWAVAPMAAFAGAVVVALLRRP